MKLVHTTLDGLDGVLGGGIPRGSLTLLVGAPGTMKSSVAYAVLHGNALQGRRGLYVSLEQSRESLVDHVTGLGFDPAAAKDHLSILDLGQLRTKMRPADAGAWLDFFKMYTASVKSGFDYEVLVLDSLDALEILAKFRDVRRSLFDLFRWLRGLAATTLLISELPAQLAPSGTIGGYEGFAKHKEDYLADGIVHLRLARRGDLGMQRQLRVVKMRGVRHSTDYHALVFEDGGFRITQVLS